jgi:2,3-dihydroxybenzoate-AMP ligase
VGELTCRGPYTLRGYYGVPEYNARQFTPDGFYRSGDLMRKHPSGNYIVEGRKKDLINRGGEKISAEEIENLILMHPAVQNVACVPMPDPNMGEKMCAFVIRSRAHAHLKELVGFLMTRRSPSSSCPSGWSAARLPGLDLRQGVQEGAGRNRRPADAEETEA